MTSNGSSVLSSMVAGVMAQKAGRTPAASLTPTVLETPNKVGPLDGKHDVMFPYDDPQTIDTAIREGFRQIEVMRQSLDHVFNGLVALAGLYGTKIDDAGTAGAIALQAEKEQRAKEAAADAKAKMAAAKNAPKPPETPEEFKADFAQKQAEAQAAVFGNPKPSATPAPEPEPDEDDDDEDDDEAPKPPADGWVCPTHGAEEISTRVSPRRQVTFRTCQVAGCGQFEKV